MQISAVSPQIRNSAHCAIQGHVIPLTLATKAFQFGMITEIVHCLQMDYRGLWVDNSTGRNIPKVALGQAV